MIPESYGHLPHGWRETLLFPHLVCGVRKQHQCDQIGRSLTIWGHLIPKIYVLVIVTRRKIQIFLFIYLVMTQKLFFI
jgi:hypothetical protein